MQPYLTHNLFWESLAQFQQHDPHLKKLAQLPYQYVPAWWQNINPETAGIYILTGGRQVGKSTSCKLFIEHCLLKHNADPATIFYLPCDEIYDATTLSQILRQYLQSKQSTWFLLIVDEITYVKNWDRVIKSLADEGQFQQGLCLLTGSDTVILKEAAMRFPGRRGGANHVDFHLYPLSFKEYVDLVAPTTSQHTSESLQTLFQNYLQTGGYLPAINDYAQFQAISPATMLSYEQWIRGDFLKWGKNENYLLAILHALVTIGVSQISYTSLTQKIGLMNKDTCIDYLQLLERMDVLFNLQAFDSNTKLGAPRKQRKFHFLDPFIYRVVKRWLERQGLASMEIDEAGLVESCVASHCYRSLPTYYFKGEGEIDVIYRQHQQTYALEVKWGNQLRAHDLRALKPFQNATILRKQPITGSIEGVAAVPVYDFLYVNSPDNLDHKNWK